MIAMCGLVAELDRLPQRNVDIILAIVIEVISRCRQACDSGPVPNVPFGTSVIGR